MNIRRRMFAIVLSLAFVLCLNTLAAAQSDTGSANSQQLTEVLRQIKALNESLQKTRTELEQSRAEIRELKTCVANLTAALPLASAMGQSAQPEPRSERVSAQAVTQEDLQVLAARVEEQHQTKVESASKFRVKLSGMILLNGFGNAGQVDNIDLANVALRPRGASGGSTGGSMRQSIIGLTGFGPTIAGAHTSGDVQLDFFGGIPSGYAGVSSGLARLRLARLRFDWKETSIIGGLDTPFFSPNSPTSYATVGEPSLSSAGNLWTWTPSIRLEHRFDFESSTWKIEAGLVDADGYGGYAPPVRYPTAAESSRQPSYSVRVSGNHGNAEHRLSVGIAGIYSPLRFYDRSKVNGAGVMVDWQVPIGVHLETSGEFFTGKGLQGFGGLPYSQVQAQDSLHYVVSTAPLLARIGEIGGWSQMKIKVDARNEFNVAAGYGGYDSDEIRDAVDYDYYIATLPSRNQSLLVNYILRPRSNLLLSAEYRRLRTTYVAGPPATADLVGVAAGFLF